MQNKPLTNTEKMERIAIALADLDRQADDLHADVADLDNAGICTGNVYWRRDNGNTPKLYANHGNQSCPIHGDPPANGRLRVYVGLDPVRQAQAVAAIERRGKKAALHQQIGQIEAQISRIERGLTDAYYAASNQQRWEW